MAKLSQNGLKMGLFHLFEHPQWSTITFGKTRFDPIVTHFWSQKQPIFKAFWDFVWPKRVTTSSKWAKNTCLSIPNGLG